MQKPLSGNDFKEQEKGSDMEIAAFCHGAFGIRFLLMEKSQVLKGSGENNVYKWPTDKNKNGWNDKERNGTFQNTS